MLAQLVDAFVAVVVVATAVDVVVVPKNLSLKFGLNKSL